MLRFLLLATALAIATPVLSQQAGTEGKALGKAPASGGGGSTPEDRTPPDDALPPDLADFLDPAPAMAASDPILTVLASSEARAQILDLAMSQARFPKAVLPPLRAALADLLDHDGARGALAAQLRQQFDQFGFPSPTDDQIARVAATMLPVWALDGVALGLPRLPSADLRAILATRLAIAESLSPERCEAYLTDWAPDARTIEISAIAAMPPDRATVVLRMLIAASLAEYRDDPPYARMDPQTEDLTRQRFGAAIMAAVDASPDPDALIAAMSPAAYGRPEDACAARVLILRTSLDLPAPVGDQALRLIADYGLDGF